MRAWGRRTSESIGLGVNRRGPSSQVELSFSARRLANRDFVSKSDPACIVYHDSLLPGGKPRELARTETIKDNLSPDWAKRIKIDYYFENKQPLIFKIYDIDLEGGSLRDQDFLGEARCDLADIVAAPNGYLTLKLTGAGFVRGDLIIHAQEIDFGQRETLCFSVRAMSLKKGSFLSKPNAYLEFHRFLDDGTRHLAYRTPVVNRSVHPKWEKLEIPIRILANLCDKDAQFLVECYDHSYEGREPRFIGACRSTVNELLERPISRHTLLKQSKSLCSPTVRKEHSAGTLTFDSVSIRTDPSFLDFIAGGLELEFGVAIDFTSSNGAPHLARSLHYIDSATPNQYELAIRSVLEICEHYNREKCFDATGFGAKVPPQYAVSHLFPLDINRMTRRVRGIAGVLQAYRDCLRTVQLYGPTHFGPTIEEFSFKAANLPRDGSKYQILLIITDGAITDMSRTKNLIIEASRLPMSIIIVGVGNDSFEKMDRLDSDADLLEHNGRRAERDIVQFVPFRDFMPANGTFQSAAEYEDTMQLLAKEVLAEVPEQVVSYMRLKGLKPRSPRLHPATIPDPSKLDFSQNTSPLPYPNKPNVPPYPTANAPPYPTNTAPPVGIAQQPPTAPLPPQQSPTAPLLSQQPPMNAEFYEGQCSVSVQLDNKQQHAPPVGFVPIAQENSNGANY